MDIKKKISIPDSNRLAFTFFYNLYEKMSPQQNYAKFDSRIVSESMEQDAYAWNAPVDYYYEDSLLSDIAYFAWDVVHGIFTFIGIWLVVTWIIYFLYIIISLFAKWGKQTILEITQVFKRIGSKITKFRKRFTSLFKKLRKRCVWHKVWTATIVVALILINFAWNVLQWDSRILKTVKIQPWYVGVDLEHKRVWNPWLHIYSPLLSSHFLSPTSVFDFEIVAATANTKEDMFVEIDYRIWFKLDQDGLIPFYQQFGSKSVRNVASDIVMPRILEVLKGIIKEYSFKEISSNHSEIKTKTIAEANKVLKPLGIEINDINVLDIRLPESYTKSIEDLENAVNALKLAEAELETEKKLAEKDLLKAENDKKIRIIEWEGIAEYNKIINSTKLSEQMLDLKRIENERFKLEKRDGKLPNTEKREDFVEIPRGEK